jgi:hypothetical protein
MSIRIPWNMALLAWINGTNFFTETSLQNKFFVEVQILSRFRSYPHVFIFLTTFLFFAKCWNKRFTFLRVSNTKTFNDIYDVCVYMYRELKRQKTSLQVLFWHICHMKVCGYSWSDKMQGCLMMHFLVYLSDPQKLVSHVTSSWILVKKLFFFQNL